MPYGESQNHLPSVMYGPTYFHSPRGDTYTSNGERPPWEDPRYSQYSGGGSYGGGGGGSSGPGGGSYQDAFNEAQNANEQRYNQIDQGYQRMMGGGSGGGQAPQSQSGTRTLQRPSLSNPVQEHRASGSALGMYERRNLQAQLERTAASRGGAYGSMDARNVYPRMYGSTGEFLGRPPQGEQQVPNPSQTFNPSNYQRPQIEQPSYATYQPPTRGNTSY